jgi:hypothetical protein
LVFLRMMGKTQPTFARMAFEAGSATFEVQITRPEPAFWDAHIRVFSPSGLAFGPAFAVASDATG